MSAFAIRKLRSIELPTAETVKGTILTIFRPNGTVLMNIHDMYKIFRDLKLIVFFLGGFDLSTPLNRILITTVVMIINIAENNWRPKPRPAIIGLSTNISVFVKKASYSDKKLSKNYKRLVIIHSYLLTIRIQDPMNVLNRQEQKDNEQEKTKNMMEGLLMVKVVEGSRLILSGK